MGGGPSAVRYFVAKRAPAFAQAKGGLGMHLSENVEINASLFDVLQACKDRHYSVRIGIPRSFAAGTTEALQSAGCSGPPHRTAERGGQYAARNEKLRRNISGAMPHRIHVSPDDIVITAGAMESLSLSLQAVTEPGIGW